MKYTLPSRNTPGYHGGPMHTGWSAGKMRLAIA